MKKIGFFGGSFNPPTNIHIEIANRLIKEKKLDEVIFIPVNDYYNKDSLINANHRYNMLKLAIKNYKNLKVDDIEIKTNKNLYAIDAFKILENSQIAKQTNKRNMFLIMGSDNYEKMPTWKDYTKIKYKYNYIIINRDRNDISSTQIRNMLNKRDLKVKKYLHKEVYDYIIKNKLYIDKS